MWNAMEELRTNNEAIAAGLREIPPVIVEQIEGNVNLPIALPITTQIQTNATANDAYFMSCQYYYTILYSI